MVSESVSCVSHDNDFNNFVGRSLNKYLRIHISEHTDFS